MSKSHNDSTAVKKILDRLEELDKNSHRPESVRQEESRSVENIYDFIGPYSIMITIVGSFVLVLMSAGILESPLLQNSNNSGLISVSRDGGEVIEDNQGDGFELVMESEDLIVNLSTESQQDTLKAFGIISGYIEGPSDSYIMKVIDTASGAILSSHSFVRSNILSEDGTNFDVAYELVGEPRGVNAGLYFESTSGPLSTVQFEGRFDSLTNGAITVYGPLSNQKVSPMKFTLNGTTESGETPTVTLVDSDNNEVEIESFENSESTTGNDYRITVKVLSESVPSNADITVSTSNSKLIIPVNFNE